MRNGEQVAITILL